MFLLLSIISLVEVYSSIGLYAYSFFSTKSPTSLFLRHLIIVIATYVAIVLISRINYRAFSRFAVLGYWIALVLLVVAMAFGRWIRIPIIGQFQPSEIAKFAVLLFFAHWASKYYHLMQLPKYSILPGVIVFGSISALLLLEPHYSGIVIIGVLTVIMLYIGGMRTKYLAIGAAALGVIILFLAVTGGLSYAMTRMDGWGQALSAERGTDLWDSTWQTRNSLYAIGSGGLWGLGLGQSRQKFLYLPEPQNDFIFAIVVEELGLIGAAIILLIFALLVWRGITLSLRAKDKFGKLLGIGLTSQIGVQVVLNILVITDWLPNTGISLPFFSYGGSSLIMLLAQMGIILSISRTANIERQ